MEQQAGPNKRLLVGLAAGVGVLLVVVGVLAGVLIASGGNDNDNRDTVAATQTRDEDETYYSEPDTTLAPTTTAYTTPPTTSGAAASYTPPPTRRPSAASSGTSYAPCPTGDIVSRIDNAELVRHDEGSEYWEYKFTLTTTNNKTGTVDWYYTQIIVNGDPENDKLLKDQTYNRAAVTLAPGQSYTFTHRPLLISSPNGPPTFSIGKISWLWPSGANYPPDCRKNP